MKQRLVYLELMPLSEDWCILSKEFKYLDMMVSCQKSNPSNISSCQFTSRLLSGRREFSRQIGYVPPLSGS